MTSRGSSVNPNWFTISGGLSTVYLNQTCFHGYVAKTGVGEGVSVEVGVGRGVQVEVGVGGGVGVEVGAKDKELQPASIHIKASKVK
ncbi:MAG: hypothetical protein OHK003_31460 [Anaerolineales bacterium]